MPDIKFSCPHCGQHITCDELWAGHELQCPGCQGTLGVPALPTPAPAARATAGGGSLVPKPPEQASPRLSLGQTSAGGSAAQVPAPSRVVPVRNLAPPPPKKSNPIVKVAVGVLIAAVLGVGGYFGFGYVSAIQEKANAKRRAAEKDSGGGEVGHTASLYAVLDATEPGKISGETGGRATGPRQRPSGVGQEIPVPADPNAPPAQAQAPAAVAAWNLDVNAAKIPAGRVSGKISGTNFTAEATRIDPVGTAQVLRMLQGTLAAPDREILIYLHPKAGEMQNGQTLTISQDMKGSTVPQVAKRWKTDPRYAPKQQNYMSGYAMNLELGAMTNGLIPGKIYLALPDAEQTVVAGAFEAVTRTADPNAQVVPVATPAANPATDPAANDAFRRRYGVRR